ncbi:hypothetical protein EUX98_g1689 [Antrodiella citrinella]|uniref:Uncharacterized protein n=1 Tax=Antrodiella citrinella TaxID=2447956 RepID=A0A4S4N0W2_9APHY|nr:hypothetical protein EUX98_g1689 [Antrodiella citrinella]
MAHQNVLPSNAIATVILQHAAKDTNDNLNLHDMVFRRSDSNPGEFEYVWPPPIAVFITMCGSTSVDTYLFESDHLTLHGDVEGLSVDDTPHELGRAKPDFRAQPRDIVETGHSEA